ncbi:MAG: bpX6 domain-containing protein [Myxococcota bacterium]
MSDDPPIPQVLHRGRVEVAALAFDVEVLGESTSRARVLASWAPGCRVTQISSRWLLLRLPKVCSVRVESAPGMVLVERQGSLVSAPLPEEWWDRELPPVGSVVLVHGGGIFVFKPKEQVTLDPAAWLELPRFAEAEVSSLGAPPAPPPSVDRPGARPLEEVMAEHGVDVKPSPTSAAVAQRLAKLGQSGGAPAPKLRWWTRLLTAVRGLLEGLRASRRAPASASEPAPRGRAGPPKPGLLGRLLERWREIQSRIILRTRLVELLGRAHAAYLEQMMRKFQDQDLEEALRWAVPLAKPGADRGPPKLSLGAPKPRTDLRLNQGEASREGGTIIAEQSLYERLRTLYRQAFARLDAEGQIERAAYVLAQLLQEPERAVSYLERHKRYRLAAEMAEQKDLDPATIARLWILAGELKIAVERLRRDGLFSQVVPKLEAQDPELGQKLRLIWADLRADAGSYAEAVRIAWNVPHAEPLLEKWIDLGLRVGGQSASELLVRRLVRFPAHREDSIQRARELLRGQGSHGAASREAFGNNLLSLAKKPEVPGVSEAAKLAFRGLLRDRGARNNSLHLPTFQHLAELAQDPVLKADLPRISPPVSDDELDFKLIQVSPEDRGSTEIFDAWALTEDRLLLGLGEAGALLLSRDGRALRRFDFPAHQLVVAKNSSRVLAVGLRRDHAVISKIDVAEGRGQAWLELELDAWSSTFDGESWFVAKGERLVSLDALDAREHALWDVSLEGPILAVEGSELGVVALARPDERRREIWSYENPGMTLRARSSTSGVEEQILALDPRSFLRVHEGRLSMNARGVTRVAVRGRYGNRIEAGACAAPAYGVVAKNERGIFEIDVGKNLDDIGIRIELPENAERVSLRITEDTAVIADRAGRILIIDLLRRAVLEDLRV